MDDLLHLLHSDGGDELRLHVGQPPMVVLEGEPQPVEGPAITAEDAKQLWQSIANTRQRRELRERGLVSFVHRFRNRASFVVAARMEGEHVGMDIH
jgi:Tfp pilus assembly ATPase PilU